MSFYIILCLANKNIIFAQDIRKPSYFEPLTWEEHVFLKEDKSIFSILIITFSINDTGYEMDIEDVSLDIIIYTENILNVYLYPNTQGYNDIKNISISTDNSVIDTNQQVKSINVFFTEEIFKYQRYSFAILLEISDIMEKRIPFLSGEIYYSFDYTLWINYPGADIDSVPLEFFSQNLEGERFEEVFPRFTITIPENLRLNSRTPSEDTRSNRLPYSYGILQEKRNGTPMAIGTGFSPGSRTSPPSTLKQNETLTWSFYEVYPFFDAEISEIIGETLLSDENIYTIGWFQPPSHIYLDSIKPYKTRQYIDLVILISTILGIALGILRVFDKLKIPERLRGGAPLGKSPTVT